MKPKKAGDGDDEADNDNDDNGNGVGIDEIGGSAVKKAGPNPYTEVPQEKNDCEGSIGCRGSNVPDTVEDGDTRGIDINDENETNDKGGDKDHNDDNSEHDEPTAPGTFFPATLLVVLTKSVLSKDCDTLLNHAIDRGEVMESNLVAVPTQEECRASALLDQPPTNSLLSGASSPANVSSSIERLRAKASYNKAYREANQHKNELGEKRLKMYQEEL